MLVKSQGIVLHKSRFSEDSVIVKIFTRQCGTVTFIVKNAFSSKGKNKQAYFAPLTLVEINFHYKQDNSLHYIKDISCPYPYTSIPFDVAKSSLLIFYNELLYKMLREVGADTLLFDTIRDELCTLDARSTVRPDSHILFLCKIAKTLGINPIDNYSTENELFSCEDACFVPAFGRKSDTELAASRHLHLLLSASDLAALPCPVKPIRNHILLLLVQYFKIHNEQIRDIQSIEILSEILSDD